MTDAYQEFLEIRTGGDTKKLDDFRDRQNKRDVGRHIYQLREKMGLSYEKFAEILGVDGPIQVESLEFGDFQGSAPDKLQEVLTAIEEWKKQKNDIVEKFFKADAEWIKDMESIIVAVKGFRNICLATKDLGWDKKDIEKYSGVSSTQVDAIVSLEGTRSLIVILEQALRKAEAGKDEEMSNMISSILAYKKCETDKNALE